MTYHPSGSTPLHKSVREEQVEAFDRLLSLRGTKLDPPDVRGQTPLHLAAALPSSYFALKLIDAGADVNALGGVRKQSPLHLALRFPHNCEIAKKLILAGSDLDAADTSGFTPLMFACWNNCHECIHMLLYFNADVSATNRFGESAFTYAVTRCFKSDLDDDLLRTLFDYTFDEFNRTCNLSLLYVCSRSKNLFRLVTDHISAVTCDDNGVVGFNDDIFHFSSELDLMMDRYPGVVRKIVWYDPRNIFFSFPKDYRYDGEDFLLFFYKFTLFVSKVWKSSSFELPGISCLISGTSENFNGDHSSYLKPLYDENLFGMVAHVASLGCPVRFRDVLAVYAKYGACELLTLLLHVVENPVVVVQNRLGFQVSLMVDLNFSIEKRLFTHNFSAVFDKTILKYFSGRTLKELLLMHSEPVSCSEVPSLLELSRTSFRKYVISRFNVRSVGMFLAYVNQLDINHVFRDIICYRKAIYNA